MKVWISDLTGRQVGYESDFPPDTKGMHLQDVYEAEYTIVTADEAGDESRADLEAKYIEKFGKKPHPSMKADKLKAAVE